MYILYTDDSILAGPNTKDIDQAIKDIKAAKINITDKGDIRDFRGVNIDHKPDGTKHLTQPYKIDQILYDLKMGEKMKPKDTSSSSS